MRPHPFCCQRRTIISGIAPAALMHIKPDLALLAPRATMAEMGDRNMRRIVRIVLLGIAVWAVPFAVAMAIFPVISPTSELFEAVMAVTLAFAATLFGFIHLSRCAAPSLDEGLFAGSIWMAMSVALDLPFFIFGPEQMRMAPADYIADVAFTYLMIPIIAGGIGQAFARR
jgi:hypothetical protein